MSKELWFLNHLNTHIVTKSMVTENQKLISNILFNQKKKTNHQKFHNTFSLVMITLLETIGMGTPHLRSTTSTTSSQSDSFNSQQIPQQPQQQQQQQPQQQNNSNNYLYYQGFQQPITNATTVSGQRQLLLHLRPLELRLHLFCTNLKFRIPHLPLQCLSKEW